MTHERLAAGRLPAMTDARTLSNSFRAVRLVALRELPPSADQGAGPFLVLQAGIPPGSLEIRSDHFVLTRGGTWTRLAAVECLDWDSSREKVLFPVAAEVMELLARLPSVPVVEPRPPGAGRDDPPAAGSFREALLRAVALEYGT